MNLYPYIFYFRFLSNKTTDTYANTKLNFSIFKELQAKLAYKI